MTDFTLFLAGQQCYSQSRLTEALHCWRQWLGQIEAAEDIQAWLQPVLAPLTALLPSIAFYLAALNPLAEVLGPDLSGTALQAWMAPLAFVIASQAKSLQQNYPPLAAALGSWGLLLEGQGYLAEAEHCYDGLLSQPELPDRLAWELKRQLCIPLFPETAAIQQRALQRACDFLAYCQTQGYWPNSMIRPDFSNAALYFSNWIPLEGMAYTAHHPWRERQRLGRILQHCLPELPGKARSTLRRYNRRVGFVLGASRAVRRFLFGLIQQLPLEHLEVCLIYTDAESAARYSAHLHRPGIQHLALSQDLPAARRQVLELELDILYYSVPNAQQTLQRQLSAFRLAPLQVTSCLSSGSTGLPEMDYFLSSRLFEPPGAQRFYSETLICHTTLPTYYYCPSAPPRLSRSYFRLPEGRLYLCPHLLYKLQPDFDTVLAELLHADPGGWLILVDNPPGQPGLWQALRRRWEKTLGQALERVIRLPFLSPEVYLGLLALGDVMLDPFYFGGGTSSYDALSLGVPMVTWPDERLHGRITLGCYLKMELEACVVSSAAAYLAKVLELAQDRQQNQVLRQQIRQRAKCLFEDWQAVEELRSFLLESPKN